MQLWQKVKNTVYRPDFFGKHTFEINRALGFYAVLLALFIALKVLIAIPGMAHFYQAVLSHKWQEQKAVITNLYPDELKLSIKDGTVSTNVSEPYPIAFPNEWRGANYKVPKNLVVIDTTRPIETSSFAEEETLLILGKNGFGYHDPSKGEFRIYDLRDKNWKESVSFTKGEYASFVATGSKILRSALLIGCVLLPIIVYAILWLAYLVYLLFGAIVVGIAAKIRGHRLGYGEAYRASIYLLPVPFLYEFLSSFGHGAYGNIPFAFTIILFFMAIINFPKVVSEASSVTPSSQTTEEKTEPASNPSLK